MVIFHSYVSLPERINGVYNDIPSDNLKICELEKHDL